MTHKIELHTYDLPADLRAHAKNGVAFDTEAMGLQYHRDRLCTVQLTIGDGVVHVVHFPKAIYNQSPNLCALLSDPNILKIAHYARFDVGITLHSFGISFTPIYCTKIASRLCRTFTDKHGLKDVCKDLLGVELSKETRASDWGASTLSAEQLRYASTDVIHLHELKNILDDLLEREGRTQLARGYFDFIPHRAQLDILNGSQFEPANYHAYIQNH